MTVDPPQDPQCIAAGNQQIESTPTGLKTYTWDYENMRTLVLLPSGARETMTYNADNRMARLRK
jgi:hypothetical protein